MRRAEKNDTTRRLGPVGSPTWHAMLDAATEALLDVGAGGLTAARVAERLGIKRRLVYYYFQTLDDLIVETFKRSSLRSLDHLREAVHSDRPLREFWDTGLHRMHPRLVVEFMALATRIDGLRTEVIHFIEESRRLQIQALTRTLAEKPHLSDLEPATIAILATSTALTLLREEELGVTEGHAEIAAMIDEFLAAAEPEPAASSL